MKLVFADTRHLTRLSPPISFTQRSDDKVVKVVVVNIHKHVKSLVLILIHEVLSLEPYALRLQAELIAATSVCTWSAVIAEKL